MVNEQVKWSSVSLYEVLSRGKRLEASVYDVEAKQAWNIVTQGKYKAVNLYSAEGPVKFAYYGGRLKRNYVSKTHPRVIGFLGSSEMLDIKPLPVKFMINSDNIKELRVKKDTILLSRSGTIGNVCYVGNTLSNYLVSEHAIRLECREFPGYVYTYLKTNIGKKLICSNIYGAVIQEIEPEHLATVPIPDAPDEIKKKIHNLVVRSYELRDESNDLIDEATALLVKELNLPPIEDFTASGEVNAFSVKLCDMNYRADASYHIPAANKIIEHIKANAFEVTTIGDRRISKDVVLPGRFKRVYVDEGFGRIFIGGKQLGELDPSGKKNLSLVQHGNRIANQLELNENMTLITRSGTVGKVTLVPKHWSRWVASEHIIRVVPAYKNIAGYINIFLASDYGKQLITRYTYGSVVDEIDDNHVAMVPIPLLKNKEVQKKINDLALEANEKRYEAYCLEQDALKSMDEEVIYAK